MERKEYFEKYYEKNKDLLNERRLYDYYIKKFGKDFVDKVKKDHEDKALNILKKHSKIMIRLNKIQKRKDELTNELSNLENIKSKL